MITGNLSEMKRGWFIGNFEPTVISTPFLEVGIISHKKGDSHPAHFHDSSMEVNVLIEGQLSINNKIFNPNDIFILEKQEIAEDIIPLTDCKVLVVRLPDITNDKVLL